MQRLEPKPSKLSQCSSTPPTAPSFSTTAMATVSRIHRPTNTKGRKTSKKKLLEVTGKRVKLAFSLSLPLYHLKSERKQRKECTFRCGRGKNETKYYFSLI